MIKKNNGNNLELEIVESSNRKFIKYPSLVKFCVGTNKSIPQATHGTVCLRGKQD